MPTVTISSVFATTCDVITTWKMSMGFKSGRGIGYSCGSSGGCESSWSGGDNIAVCFVCVQRRWFIYRVNKFEWFKMNVKAPYQLVQRLRTEIFWCFHDLLKISHKLLVLCRIFYTFPFNWTEKTATKSTAKLNFQKLSKMTNEFTIRCGQKRIKTTKGLRCFQTLFLHMLMIFPFHKTCTIIKNKLYW